MGSYNSANDFRSDVEEHFRYLVTEFGFEPRRLAPSISSLARGAPAEVTS